MKKRLKGLLAAGIILSNIMITTTNYNGTTVLAADTPFFKQEEVKECWVGDTLGLHMAEFQGYAPEKIEVVEGDSVTAELECVKEGKSIVQVDYTQNGESKSEQYTINVTRGKDTTLDTYSKSIKIGENVQYTVSNLLYGHYAFAKPLNISKNFMAMSSGGGWLIYPDRTVADNVTFPNSQYTRVGESYMAIYPGTVEMGFYHTINRDDDANKKLISTGMVTVEEPVVKTNAPKMVMKGSSLNLTTELTNIKTDFSDTHLDQVGKELLEEIYEPEITVLEGQDCIKQSNQNYQDFSTKEDIEFVKSGTVKLSVKYKAVDPNNTNSEVTFNVKNNICDLYTAEKIVTIQVVDENENIVQNVAEEDISVLSKETLDKIIENNNTLQINCMDNQILKYAWTFAPKDINSLLDVKLKINLLNQDEEVKAIIGNQEYFVIDFEHAGKLPDNTTVKVKVPDTLKSGKNVFIYHLKSDGTAQLFGERKIEEGYLSFNPTHCSKYFVTTKKIEADTIIDDEEDTDNKENIADTGKTPTNPKVEIVNENNDETPKTGDTASVVPYIILLVACVGSCGLILRRRNYQK